MNINKLIQKHYMKNSHIHHYLQAVLLGGKLTLFQLICVFYGSLPVDSDVGKTTFLRRQYTSDLPTTGVDFESFAINYDNQTFKLLVWDTPGLSSCYDLSIGHVRGKEIVFCMYDVRRRSSFVSAIERLNTLREQVRLFLYLNCQDL